ncbi:hypothetical protein BDZ97DRAFT_1273077 [Flammula alnicola]|nr:hypothetical protein BDZ97DRAFT_1273077 [Flammula alnicola]
MSDFEDDIDDQLLELAGATEKKKKRRQPSSGSGSGNVGGSGKSGVNGSKKRRAERMDTDSDKGDAESEEEMEDPYPLEGKYRDEADKRELLAMTEFQREQILEERSGERQRIQNAKMLADLVRQQQRGGAIGADDSVSRAAKRQHTARGATKEKAHKLDELKAKRKAKDDKKRSKGNASPSQRDRSSSPQDMDISDSESEDGQITKYDQEEERIMNLTSGYDSHKKGRSGAKDDAAEEACTMAALEGCRLTRDAIAKHCIKPWFQDYVTGAWVRYLIGQEPTGAPVYRICQVHNLASDFVKPYKVDNKTINQAFELKHGKSIKIFNMDKVSNGPFLEKEYDRLAKTCATEDVKLPTKQALETKVAQMQKLVTQPMTEKDITAMLQRKSQLQAKNTTLSTVDRSMLNQQRTLALRRQDYDEVAEIDAKLAADAAKMHEPAKAEPMDLLAKVNERNRKANMEAVRKAELEGAERKRRERKLAMESGGTSTPIDPSARLKITPRTFNASTPTTTRPGTPVVNGGPATETPVAAAILAAAAAKAPVPSASSFESSLIDSIEIDLGDF